MSTELNTAFIDSAFSMQCLHTKNMRSFRARLLGLHAFPVAQQQQCALLFEQCRAVHGFCLYGQHCVLFVDADFILLRRALLRPNRWLYCRKAHHTVELPYRCYSWSTGDLCRYVHWLRYAASSY